MTTLKEYKIRMSNKFKGVALSGQPNNTKPTTDIINERDENLKLEKVMLPHVIERSEKFPHIYLEPLNSSIGTVIHGIDITKQFPTFYNAIHKFNDIFEYGLSIK